VTDQAQTQPSSSSVDLYWLPLGAGDNTHCVRTNGRIYEALTSRYKNRNAQDLYHSALEVTAHGEQFVIEMTPAWGNGQDERGVVCEGAVGLPWLGVSQFFRYEVRRWRNGTIPDASEAVASPQRMSTDIDMSQRLLDLTPAFATATWGRDELHTGEMWNSNSLISWLLARSGHSVELATLPPAGRAPGWDAGLVVASRLLSQS